MKLATLLILCYSVCAGCFSIQLQQSDELDRQKVFKMLFQLQSQTMLPNFRRSKNQVDLQSFKQDQDKKILAYFGQIQVGQTNQKFNVLFDSGSTNVFIMSDDCKSQSCQNHHLYELTDQASILQSDNQIQYICGKSTGLLIESVVGLTKQLRIANQAIHVGQQVDIAAFVNSRWDGIAGLGFYPAIDSEHELDSVQQSKLSIIDNILQQRLLKNDKQFFIYSLNSQGGKISFGEYPRLMDRTKITWQNIDFKNINEEVSWVLKLQDVYLQYKVKPDSQNIANDTVQQILPQSQQQQFTDDPINFNGLFLNRLQQIKQQKPINLPKTTLNSKQVKQSTLDKMRFLQKKLRTHKLRKNKYRLKSRQKSRVETIKVRRKNDLCPNGCKLLIDTGTYLNYIPQEMYRKLMSDFDFKTNICKDMQTLPDIVFVFDNNNQIILKPKQYLEMYQTDGQQICTNSFTPDDVENDIITLGQMFLKTFHTIFDFGNKRIGFSSNLNDHV